MNSFEYSCIANYNSNTIIRLGLCTKKKKTIADLIFFTSLISIHSLADRLILFLTKISLDALPIGGNLSAQSIHRYSIAAVCQAHTRDQILCRRHLENISIFFPHNFKFNTSCLPTRLQREQLHKIQILFDCSRTFVVDDETNSSFFRLNLIEVMLG